MTAPLRASVRLFEDSVAIGQQEDSHTLLLDRPRATGGTELGFNGGHLLLLGWGACFKSNLVAAAAARNIEILAMELRIEGNTTEKPGRFSSLRMEVHLEVAGDDPDRDKLVKLAERSCMVSNTLHRATDVVIVTV